MQSVHWTLFLTPNPISKASTHQNRFFKRNSMAENVVMRPNLKNGLCKISPPRKNVLEQSEFLPKDLDFYH